MRARTIRMALAVLALATAPLAGPGAGPARAETETLREQSERVLEAGGITRLRVENARGAIEVRPSADGRIHLKALKTVRAQTAEQARTLSRGTTVSAETSAGVLRIAVRYPQRQSVRIGFMDLLKGYEVPSVQVRLVFEAPPALAVDLQSVSGDVATASLAGPQSLTSTSGDISVAGATGPCVVNTTSGDLELGIRGAVRARSVSGDVLVESGGGVVDAHTTSGGLSVRGTPDSLLLGSVSGDVQVERAAHGLRATSTSGDIEVRSASGRVALQTGSGSIDLVLMAPLTSAEVTSGSGNLGVRFAAGAGGVLDLRTSSGTIDADAPIEVEDVTRHRVTGRIGSGSAPVSLRSSSGDIRITTGGN